MSKFAFASGGTGLALGAGAAALVAIVGIYAAGKLETPQSPVSTPDAPDSQTSAKPVDQLAETPATKQAVAVAEPVPDRTLTEEVAAPSAETPDPVEAAQSVKITGAADPATPAAPREPADAVPDATAPRFDLVRVEPDGSTLIAGAAKADSSVEVLLDGELQDRVTSDFSGQFISFLSLPPSSAVRVLSLRATDDAGTVTSVEEVIIAPSADAAGLPAATAAAELPVTARPGLPVVQPGAESVAPGPAKPAADGAAVATVDEAPTASAPAVILSRASGLEILQSPVDTGAPPEATSSVALDAITYEDDGEVILTGRGAGQDTVRIYLDNQPVTSARIRADGRWRAELPDVDTGTYTLRVDELTADGRVTSRVESPFLREEPSALAATLTRDVLAQAITVQPGNTLWAIARDRYGEGTAYVRVFEANRDSIRNPDLIYPGQVFAIPDN